MIILTIWYTKEPVTEVDGKQSLKGAPQATKWSDLGFWYSRKNLMAPLGFF